MKNAVMLATMVVLFCSNSGQVFSQQTTTKPTGQNEWEMHKQNGDPVCTFKKTEQGDYKFYNANGEYLGLILHSGKLLPYRARSMHTMITPETARLYLDVLGVIETMK